MIFWECLNLDDTVNDVVAKILFASRQVMEVAQFTAFEAVQTLPNATRHYLS